MVQPTKGEWFLLNYLKDNLDNSFEIFFNPFLDGDRPDFVILKKNVGVFIIEVKDWNINSQKYRIDLFNKWYFNSNSGYKVIKSPFSQAFNYKKNFYDIHIPLLGIKNVINPYFFNVIDIFVYLHCTDKDVFERFYEQNNQIFNQYVSDFSKGVYVNFPMDKIEYYRKKQQRDKNLAIFQENIERIKSRKKHPLFKEEIYNKFKRRLSPSQFFLEQGKVVELDKKQEKLTQSSTGFQKIKGVAGCGKTEVLVHRAVNAFERINAEKILILTFNNSLKSYIRYRLYGILRNVNKQKFEKIERDIFEITNYHRFYISQANNMNIEIEPMINGSINNIQFRKNIFQENENRYDVILVDEIQDYEPDWIKIVRDSFLSEQGEMVIFGDQTQNIYKRDIKSRESSLVHGFGTWQKLTKSYRSCLKLIDIFAKFKETFLVKYKEEESYEYKAPQQGLLDVGNEIIIFHKSSSVNDAFDKIRKIILSNNLIQNDTCILSSKINILQQIEHLFNLHHEKTTTTFETLKEIQDIYDATANMPDKARQASERKKRCDDLRRIKKEHFHINSGLVKISTIHSFKGLEMKNVFVVINEDDIPELVYTGITRSIENLFVISLNNSNYDEFINSVADKS